MDTRYRPSASLCRQTSIQARRDGLRVGRMGIDRRLDADLVLRLAQRPVQFPHGPRALRVAETIDVLLLEFSDWRV